VPAVSGEEQRSVYEAVGGSAWFDALVDRFYEGVATDPRLRPMYPPDLTEPKRHLSGFLAQYWGGPPDYSAERGHPRLRMRHMPFVIGPAERDAWLQHMTAALDAMAPPPEVGPLMRSYFEQAAAAMINAG
jgi:hemoglobin